MSGLISMTALFLVTGCGSEGSKDEGLAVDTAPTGGFDSGGSDTVPMPITND